MPLRGVWRGAASAAVLGGSLFVGSVPAGAQEAAPTQIETSPEEASRDEILRGAGIDLEPEAVVGWLRRAAGKPQSPAAPEALRTLIEQLGDDDFAVRERAAQALRAAGRGALPALEAASRDADAERVARVQAIANAIRTDPTDAGRVHDAVFGFLQDRWLDDGGIQAVLDFWPAFAGTDEGRAGMVRVLGFAAENRGFPPDALKLRILERLVAVLEDAAEAGIVREAAAERLEAVAEAEGDREARGTDGKAWRAWFSDQQSGEAARRVSRRLSDRLDAWLRGGAGAGRTRAETREVREEPLRSAFPGLRFYSVRFPADKTGETGAPAPLRAKNVLARPAAGDESLVIICSSETLGAFCRGRLQADGDASARAAAHVYGILLRELQDDPAAFRVDPGKVAIERKAGRLVATGRLEAVPGGAYTGHVEFSLAFDGTNGALLGTDQASSVGGGPAGMRDGVLERGIPADEARRVREYWTEERMRDARPMPMPTPREEPDR